MINRGQNKVLMLGLIGVLLKWEEDLVIKIFPKHSGDTVPACGFTCFSIVGFHWTRRQAGSFYEPVWTLSWCSVSRWPCWQGMAAERRQQGGSVSMCWTSMTMHLFSRKRRMLALWERTNRLSSRWHESGWDVFKTKMPGVLKLTNEAEVTLLL